MPTRTVLMKQREAETEHGAMLINGDPATPVDGEIWINTSSQKLKFRNSGVTSEVLTTVATPEVPTGTILSFAGPETAPIFSELVSGRFKWLVCDGRAISSTTYQDLLLVIGNLWGAGAPAGTFYLPDLRGHFLRGKDSSSAQGAAGVDPDSATRTKRGDITPTAEVGSLQGDALQSHTHTLTYSFQQGGSGTSIQSSGDSSNPALYLPTTTPIGAAVSSGETRPTNAYVIYMIKT